jgi:23S rRNA pseudouridine2605 synthase
MIEARGGSSIRAHPMVAADEPLHGPLSMRLAKYLAHAGVASRRSAEALVRAGRVTVGEEVVTDPARDVQEDSRVALDGRPVGEPEPRVLYVLNKPVGVVSTARDTHGRPTVLDLVPAPRLPAVRPERGVPFRVRLYPVGRLDADSSGLILLTNDGELANRLMHPRFEVPKTYRARVGGGPVGDDALSRLRRGVQLEDGLTAPAQVRRAGSDGRSRSTIELTIHEGRNSQVRRMCEAVGHPVLALERIAFGPLRLGSLAPGAHRRLSDAELERVRAAVTDGTL